MKTRVRFNAVTYPPLVNRTVLRQWMGHCREFILVILCICTIHFPPHVQDNRIYVEYALAYGRKGVVLQLGGWTRDYIFLIVKD